MDELPRSAKEWLARAKRADIPSAGASERVRRRVAAVVGTESGTRLDSAMYAGAPPTLTPTMMLSDTATKLLVAVGVVAALGGAVLAGHLALAPAPRKNSRNAMATSVATSHNDSEPQPAMRTIVAATQPLPLRPLTGRPEERRSNGLRHEGTSLLAEMALLAQASEALNQGDAARGRQLLAVHRRRFPNGELREERRGLAVLTNCVANGRGNASSAAEYLRAFPNGVLSARIERACALAKSND